MGDKMSRVLRALFVWYVLLVASLAFPYSQSIHAQSESPLVLVLTADAPVAPPMVEYLERGLQTAEKRGAELIVLQLNTPGGSLDAMNDMLQAMRASPTPVVVYVAPRGAMAASAGTLVTLAAHAAAMAPETTIGAASPVGPEGQDLGETLAAKEKNALKATVRGLTRRRGEQAVSVAEETIETAMAVSAEEALEIGLIDFIAEDLDSLLVQLDGFQVETSSGQVVLETEEAQVEELPISFIEQLLVVLTNPNIVFLLLSIGVQAILIEISSPGGWLAGFIGVVCLALATYGLGVLPVNWFGILFLIIAFVLFILDIKAPTHGALTAAGVASLIVGGLVLFNSPSVPSFQRVSVPLVVGTSIATGAIFAVILTFALRAQKTPVQVGMESLVGRAGRALTSLNPYGQVQVASEQWSAKANEGSIPKGKRVEVVKIEGVRLVVKSLDDD
jgi:membrane-bound serine protease (ClpP class)